MERIPKGAKPARFTLSGKSLRRSNRPNIRRLADMRSERLWLAGGIALAGVIAATATMQVRDNDGMPKIYGAEHLALFAQASRGRAPDDAGGQSVATSSTKSPVRATAPAAVDFETTATIRTDREPDADREAGVVGAPALKSVERGSGAFRTPNGVVMRRVGETAPDGRRIVAFKRRDGEWVAVVSPQTSR